MGKVKISSVGYFKKEVEAAYNNLLDLIHGIPDNVKYLSFLDGKPCCNIRDIFGHIVGWQMLFLEWYNQGLKDRIPDMPSKGYTWKMTGVIDLKIWTRFQNSNYLDCESYLAIHYNKIMDILNTIIDDEMFSESYYRWTGNKNMFYFFEKYALDIYISQKQVIEKSLKRHKIEVFPISRKESMVADEAHDELITSEIKEVTFDEPVEMVEVLSLEQILEKMDEEISESAIHVEPIEEVAIDEQKNLDDTEDKSGDSLLLHQNEIEKDIKE